MKLMIHVDLKNNKETYFFNTISEAPLLYTRKPPPGLGITVLIDLRTELNVNT